LNVCIQMLNESLWLKTAFKTASQDDDVIIIMIFTINQMILRKTLIIIMKMKSCLSNKRKSDFFNVFFFFFIKCMQSMTMTLSRLCMYAKLHVTWSKSLLYIFSLINHIDSLRIQALSLKLSSSYSRFSLFLRTLRVLLFRF